MGRTTQKASDREEMPKLKRKRWKTNVDKIHSKILKAKKKLDNTGKDDNKSRQRRHGQAKICSRLLPRPAVGIYRNGAKGKDIQKAKTSENTFNKARLKADALKLFNGDTPKSTCIVEIPIHDENSKQSPNKCFVKNSLEWTPGTLEQSPILSKRQSQNQKLCLIKKKGEENFFENLDPNKIKKQNVNDESKYATQKEDMCKRRLFQNDRKQLEAVTSIQSQIFDDIDLTKENSMHEKKAQQTGSENSQTASPLNHYVKLCKIISTENFEGNFLQNYQSDPLTTTIKRLRHAYADSFRQHLLREKKQGLINVESSPFTLEYQACTYSDTSQLSPVEFEVPKCSKNRTIAAHLQEDVSHKKEKFYLVHNPELKKRGDAMHYSSTSYLRNSSVEYNISSSIMENRESNNNQCAEQSSDIHQSPKPINFYFVNEKDPAQLNSQKNRNYITHAKNKRHNKDNVYIDIPDYENSRYIDNTKHSIFSNDPILLAGKHLSKDYAREITISNNSASNNVPQKHKDRTTNKCNMKNVKRIPPILRRCNNVTTDKNNSVRINDHHTEDLYKKFETNLFSGNPSNGIAKRFYETELPNMFEDLPTHNNAYNNSNSTPDVPFDRTKILEPQIGSMKIKDSQESQIDTFDMNMRHNGLNGENEFCRFDHSLHPRIFDVSRNTKTYIEKLTQQEQVVSNMKKHIFHSNNYRPVNYLQSASNSSVQQATQFPQHTKSHMCESNNSKQELFRKNTCDQNQNILFRVVNDKAISTANFSQNIPTDKRSREPACRKMFDKTDVECAKNQTNQNACRCTERYIYFDSDNCPRKCNVSRAHHLHEETAQTMAQSEILCDTKGYDNSTDNCINLSNVIRNVPLSLEQKHHLYRYGKMNNAQHRAMLLQNVTQPIKYLAVKNGPDIQRIPVYIHDGTVRVTENAPLKVVALMGPNIQTKAFPQEVTAQVIPLQTNNPQFNDFATNNQPFVRHLDSVNAIVLDTDSQASTWYASNL